MSRFSLKDLCKIFLLFPFLVWGTFKVITRVAPLEPIVEKYDNFFNGTVEAAITVAEVGYSLSKGEYTQPIQKKFKTCKASETLGVLGWAMCFIPDNSKLNPKNLPE
jgi:hypothetical protein